MPAGTLRTIVERFHRAAPAAGPDPTDGELLSRFIAHRDAAAFEALVRRHGPMVLGVCRRVLGRHHDAEDAFQATFIVLARRAAAVWPRDRVAAWLHGVAVRTALKAKAQAARRRQREQQARAMSESSAPPPDLADLWPVLDGELNRLPEKYRAPVVLCDLEGKTHAEAARLLGWPVGTVSGRLVRARAMLHRRLTRRGVALSAAALAALHDDAAAVEISASLIRSTVAVGLAPAGPAAFLADGVIRTMTIPKRVIAAALLVVLAGATAGGFRLLAPAADPPAGPVIRLADTGRFTLTGHTDWVYGVAFSPDGRLLATGGNDRTVRLWDPATGKEVRTLTAGQQVYGVAFSPDGRHVAAAAGTITWQGTGGLTSRDPGELRVWEVDTGRAVMSLTGHTVSLFCLAYSPDGRRIAAGGAADGGTTELILWDLTTREPVFRHTHRNALWPVHGVAFSPDGRRLAVGGIDRSVHVLETATGQEIHSLRGHTDPVYAVAFSPDGSRLASGGLGKPKAIRVWDSATGELQRTIRTSHWSAIRGLAFTPDGRAVASAGLDGEVKVVAADSGQELLAVKAHTANANAVAFSPDGKRLATAGSDKLVQLYTLHQPAAAVNDRPEAQPAPKPGDGDARQVAAAFLTAAKAGELQDARALTPGNISDTKIQDVAKTGVKGLELVFAGATTAHAISGPVEVKDGGRTQTGYVVLMLVRKDDRWRVKDIDFDDADRVLRKIRSLIEDDPTAKPVPDPTVVPRRR